MADSIHFADMLREREIRQEWVEAAELNPDTTIIDTLVEAYYANGDLNKAIEICREQLAKTPNESMFKDRLEKYLKEKK